MGEGYTPLPEVTELRTPKKPLTAGRQKVEGAEVGLWLARGTLRGERPHPGCRLLVWSVAESFLG